MAQSVGQLDVYLEVGAKRVFAGAVDWPGWCRSGRDEATALEALVAYGPRYARVLQTTGLTFQAPAEVSALAVVERLEGNATTDFGAPDAAPSGDALPLDEAELRQLRKLLEACWQAFDATVRRATGRLLRTGPRGGGRDLDRIVGHVLEADAAYLMRLGWKPGVREEADADEALRQTRQAILDGLDAAAKGGIAAVGPRGGARWTPRYFVRRVAWHVLDHLWEVEDRVA